MIPFLPLHSVLQPFATACRRWRTSQWRRGRHSGLCGEPLRPQEHSTPRRATPFYGKGEKKPEKGPPASQGACRCLRHPRHAPHTTAAPGRRLVRWIGRGARGARGGSGPLRRARFGLRDFIWQLSIFIPRKGTEPSPNLSPRPTEPLQRTVLSETPRRRAAARAAARHPVKGPPARYQCTQQPRGCMEQFHHECGTSGVVVCSASGSSNLKKVLGVWNYFNGW